VSKNGNGRSSIHRRKNTDGWEGWVSFGNDTATGKRVRKHVRGKTKTEVAEKIKCLETARDAGYTALGHDVTLLEWIDYWIDRKRSSVRPKTIAGYLVDRTYVEASGVGKVRLTKLIPEDVERLYALVLARPTCSAGTAAHRRRTLSAAYNTAVSRGRISRNPVKLAQTPRHEVEEVEPLTSDEAKPLLATASEGRNPARWSVGLALGLRQGEALGLQWPDLDLDAGIMRIRRQLQRQTWQHGCLGVAPCGRKRGANCPACHGGGLVTADPKSAAGRRLIGLPPH
jgi:integrase